MKITFLFFFLAFIFLGGCKCGTDIPTKYTFAYGEWRGAFATSEGELPFLFEVKHLNNDSIEFTLINGKERITTLNADIIGDSLIAEMPVYESVLIGKIKGTGKDTLEGVWIKTAYDKETAIPFKAVYGGKYLFASHNTQIPTDISGTYSTTFLDSGSSEQGIGTFEQAALEIRGSFLTPTGDYRYLTGIVEKDSVFLSGFDGASAYLVKGKIFGSKISGKLVSANGKFRAFEAIKSDAAAMEDLKTEIDLGQPVTFSLPNHLQQKLTFPSEKYRNKVVILQILGTWCHNCIDETNYLAQRSEMWKKQGVEIIGLSFERTDMEEKGRDNIRRLVERFKVKYPILLAGQPKPESLQKTFPQIKEVLGYPTTILIGKDGKVADVHVGFSGPATGKFYQQYQQEFESKIAKLLK
jgi:thiol-disulfide isomerase/thioredoxin